LRPSLAGHRDSAGALEWRLRPQDWRPSSSRGMDGSDTQTYIPLQISLIGE
jgi:hypothetical protein